MLSFTPHHTTAAFPKGLCGPAQGPSHSWPHAPVGRLRGCGEGPGGPRGRVQLQCGLEPAGQDSLTAADSPSHFLLRQGGFPICRQEAALPALPGASAWPHSPLDGDPERAEDSEGLSAPLQEPAGASGTGTTHTSLQGKARPGTSEKSRGQRTEPGPEHTWCQSPCQGLGTRDEGPDTQKQNRGQHDSVGGDGVEQGPSLSPSPSQAGYPELALSSPSHCGGMGLRVHLWPLPLPDCLLQGPCPVCRDGAVRQLHRAGHWSGQPGAARGSGSAGEERRAAEERSRRQRAGTSCRAQWRGARQRQQQQQRARD